MKSYDVAAVVTGGASGLGEATVRALAGRGAAVTVLDLDETRGPALAAELGGDTTFVRTDVTDEPSVRAAIDAVFTTTPRSPSSAGSVRAIAAAARRSTLKVPTRFTITVRVNAPRS